MAALLAGASCGDDASDLCAGDGSGCACVVDDECAAGLHCYQDRCLPDDDTDGNTDPTSQSQSSTGASTGEATSSTTADEPTTSNSSGETSTGAGLEDQSVCRDYDQPIEPGAFAGFEDTIELPSGAAISSVRIELTLRTPDASGVSASLAGAQRITSLYGGGECSQGADLVATFDEDAAATISETCPGGEGISGEVRPDGDLGTFVGRDLGGAWTLRVRDMKFSGDAVLERWCLHVDVKPGAADTDPSDADAVWLRPKSLGDAGRRVYTSWGYDPDRDVIVGFGGCSQVSSSFNCHSPTQKMTVEWDGEQWQDIDTPQRPGGNQLGHHGGSMAYDESSGALVLFGGYPGPWGSGPTDETWTYDGITWTQQSPAMSPSARAEQTMVWDPDGAQIVLYGGHDPNGMTKVLSDVWSWDGESWSPLPSQGGPGPLHAHAAAWHSGLSRMLVFGGFASPGYPTSEKNPQLWSYDPAGGQWAQHEDAPIGVSGSKIVYDGVRDRLIMFGGREGSQGTIYAGTYEWDGAAWSTLTKPVWEPVARFHHGMVWMEPHGVAFLYGGYYSLAANDTWYYTRVP